MIRIIPEGLRLTIKLIVRSWYDRFLGINDSLAKACVDDYQFQEVFSLSKPIPTIPSAYAYTSNIKTAVNLIEKVVIEEDEVFSLWHILGRPTLKHGYLKLPDEANQKPEGTYFAGLSYLSSLLHYIALETGLEIIERHHHFSKGFDSDPWLPFLQGEEAVVAYGFKDLRFRNTYGFPLKFKFDVTDLKITVNLLSTSPIERQMIHFEKQEISEKTQVSGRNKRGKIVNISVYKNTESIIKM